MQDKFHVSYDHKLAIASCVSIYLKTFIRFFKDSSSALMNFKFNFKFVIENGGDLVYY